MWNKLKENKIFLLIIVFIIGCAVGAIFYPTKTITKEVEVDKKTTLELVEKLKSSLSSMETQNIKLKQQIKEHSQTVISPDGTTTITVDRETNNDQEQTIVKELTAKYENEIAQYKTEIEKQKEYSKVEINKKKFGVAVGMMLDKDIYANMQYTFFGPLFLDLHLNLANELQQTLPNVLEKKPIYTQIGVGIGISF